VTNVKTGESELHIYDAASMKDRPVSRVRIPHRIPYGFHALHMNDVQFHQQLPLHLQLESLANVRVKMTSGCIRPVKVGFAEEAFRPRSAVQ
jgi:Retinal pigment epithelial membrane protein